MRVTRTLWPSTRRLTTRSGTPSKIFRMPVDRGTLIGSFLLLKQAQCFLPGALLESGAGTKLRGLPPVERFGFSGPRPCSALVIHELSGRVYGSPQGAAHRGERIPLPRLK